MGVADVGEDSRAAGGDDSEMPLSVSSETASSLDKLRRLRTILMMVVLVLVNLMATLI